MVTIQVCFGYYTIIMKKILLLICFIAVAAFVWKLFTSEQLRIVWNHPLHFYDGRHKLSGTDKSVNFDLKGELWIRDKTSGEFVRIIPNAGIEFTDEQNLSFSSSRTGERKMLKLRSQWSNDAEKDYKSAEWVYKTNKYLLYFEQRDYNNDDLISYYKDFAYGRGGLFFVNPENGDHIAHKNFSTVYVPEPKVESYAGPTNWLWAAAANRKFVEESISNIITTPPKKRTSSGKKGQMAFDDKYMYFYTGDSTGWIRVKTDQEWE